MSNEQEILEVKIVKYLKSKVFLDDIKNSNLDEQEYNILLATHVLAIGFSTTGISSGGFSLKYFQRISPVKEDFNRVENKFYFYTTKNGLIENTPRCSNVGMNFNNEYISYRNSRQFKTFINDYFNNNYKTIEKDVFDKLTLIHEDIQCKFSLNGTKRKTEEGIKNFYNQITRDSTISYLLNNFYLTNKTEAIKTKKIKL